MQTQTIIPALYVLTTAIPATTIQSVLVAITLLTLDSLLKAGASLFKATSKVAFRLVQNVQVPVLPARI